LLLVTSGLELLQEAKRLRAMIRKGMDFFIMSLVRGKFKVLPVYGQRSWGCLGLIVKILA